MELDRNCDSVKKIIWFYPFCSPSCCHVSKFGGKICKKHREGNSVIGHCQDTGWIRVSSPSHSIKEKITFTQHLERREVGRGSR
jgi:hypothetical protein